MYRYTDIDQRLVDERVAQFRSQLQRWQKGELSDDEFRPLRLQNGFYIQRHAPMLRVAIPYGLLSSSQLRQLAYIARKYDKSYGHFTTRQNIQYNWFKLEDGADMLADLAQVQMHGIQTSGNCVRNITTDQFAGVAQDEYVDPRPFAELLRQWSTFHPEFAYLPRKFKIAINAARADRAAIAVHDIGLYLRTNEAGQVVVDVLAGGGLGRTPVIGTIIRRDLPWQHSLSYCEAILRVYNRYGRRDNKYKARIKILLKALGAEEFTRQVDEEFAQIEHSPLQVLDAELARIAADFVAPAYRPLPDHASDYELALKNHPAFARWVERNAFAHKVPGYRAVTISLKKTGVAPGDASADQMDAVAQLADDYSFGELRVSHEQNLILADVEQGRLFDLWQALKKHGLETPNIGLLT
ncbi:MAG: nitrite/sulfite reductase, partial [Burkholderiales bacterium]|nr:nitrite/sulfite reductase [Burkholderiales bacterium]